MRGVTTKHAKLIYIITEHSGPLKYAHKLGRFKQQK